MMMKTLKKLKNYFDRFLEGPNGAIRFGLILTISAFILFLLIIRSKA